MNRQDPKKKVPPSPALPGEPSTDIPRSGAGAGTAFLAMLKKRQMRASDAETQADPPDAPAKKTVNE